MAAVFKLFLIRTWPKIVFSQTHTSYWSGKLEIIVQEIIPNVFVSCNVKTFNYTMKQFCILPQFLALLNMWLCLAKGEKLCKPTGVQPISSQNFRVSYTSKYCILRVYLLQCSFMFIFVPHEFKLFDFVVNTTRVGKFYQNFFNWLKQGIVSKCDTTFGQTYRNRFLLKRSKKREWPYGVTDWEINCFQKLCLYRMKCVTALKGASEYSHELR